MGGRGGGRTGRDCSGQEPDCGGYDPPHDEIECHDGEHRHLWPRRRRVGLIYAHHLRDHHVRSHDLHVRDVHDHEHISRPSLEHLDHHHHVILAARRRAVHAHEQPLELPVVHGRSAAGPQATRRPEPGQVTGQHLSELVPPGPDHHTD